MLEKIEKFQVLLLGLILSITAIVVAGIFSKVISKDVISVTGSYSQEVVSDRGKYEFFINSREKSQLRAYAVLKKQIPVIKKYLLSQGFSKDDIDVSSINGYDVYEINTNGNSTNNVIAFNASQKISVTSNDVKKIKRISTDIEGLVEQGIVISGSNTEYYYSKLSDLKIEMLKKASIDAKQRAAAMLKATHNRVGKIQSVQMGVFQITPVDSTNVSDYGLSDTSSIKKKVTSVANVSFRVK